MADFHTREERRNQSRWTFGRKDAAKMADFQITKEMIIIFITIYYNNEMQIQRNLYYHSQVWFLDSVKMMWCSIFNSPAQQCSLLTFSDHFLFYRPVSLATNRRASAIVTLPTGNTGLLLFKERALHKTVGSKLIITENNQNYNKWRRLENDYKLWDYLCQTYMQTGQCSERQGNFSDLRKICTSYVNFKANVKSHKKKST